MFLANLRGQPFIVIADSFGSNRRYCNIPSLILETLDVTMQIYSH